MDSFKGYLGVIFQTPPNMSSKKAYLGVNRGEKIVQNSHLGDVFPGEGNLRLGYVSKPLVMHVYNTSIRVKPRPPLCDIHYVTTTKSPGDRDVHNFSNNMAAINNL